MRANGRRDSGEGSEAVAGGGHRRRRAARHGGREHGEQRGRGAAVDGGSLGSARARPRQRGAEGVPPPAVTGGHDRSAAAAVAADTSATAVTAGWGRRRNPPRAPRLPDHAPAARPRPVAATAAQSGTPVARDTKTHTSVSGISDRLHDSNVRTRTLFCAAPFPIEAAGAVIIIGSATPPPANPAPSEIVALRIPAVDRMAGIDGPTRPPTELVRTLRRNYPNSDAYLPSRSHRRAAECGARRVPVAAVFLLAANKAPGARVTHGGDGLPPARLGGGRRPAAPAAPGRD